jgi:hypothetical protein
MRQLEDWQNRRDRFFVMVQEVWKRNRARNAKPITKEIIEAVERNPTRQKR